MLGERGAGRAGRAVGGGRHTTAVKKCAGVRARATIDDFCIDDFVVVCYDTKLRPRTGRALVCWFALQQGT